VRSLCAGQDGSSEPGYEGAVLALNLAASSPNIIDERLAMSLLRKVWLATPEEVMRVFSTPQMAYGSLLT
jgi:hypothetical protein